MASSSRLMVTSLSRLVRPSASSCRSMQTEGSAMPRIASVDRYTIVQTFFRKQVSNSRLSPIPATQSTRFFSSSPSRLITPKPPTFPIDLKTKSTSSSSILPVIPNPKPGPKDALDESSSPPLPPDPTDSTTHNSFLTAPSDQDPSPTPPVDRLTPHPSRLALLKTYPSSLRRLAALLPASHLSDPHSRPTKADLLKLTDSWFQRLRIRWKWFTIRGFRKFGPDEWSAVASWVLVGNLGWLVLGTTTFFGMVLLTANSLSLQGHIAQMLSDYFTSGSGITVIFESALVPNLLQSTISLRNVFISRRPFGHSYHRTSFDSAHQLLDENGEAILPACDTDEDDDEEKEDTNYSMFDLNVDSIDVTLNFMSWLNGDGLVKKAVVRGVRGVVDRRSVTWDPDAPWTPSEWRHPVQPGDGSFNLDSLQVEDLLCTVYQPGGFRPYNVSIFKADLGKFRKKWLFLDVLSAESITGQYDNCLFSLHKPQRIGKTMGEDEKDGKWMKMARMRIDGLPIDHCQGATTTGPLAWITSGKLDGVIDIKFPRHPDDDVDFTSVLSEIIDNVQEIATSSTSNPTPTLAASSSNLSGGASREVINPGQRPLGKPALVAPEVSNWREMMLGKKSEQEMAREVVMDIDLRFRDLKAAVPYRAAELSYVNSALIRPIVAFINANRTLLPIQCRVVQDLSEFDGSWTPFETGLLDSTSNQVYSALAHHVTSQTANTQRMKAVGVWSLQMSAEMLVAAVRTAVLQGRDFGLSSPQGEMMVTL